MACAKPRDEKGQACIWCWPHWDFICSCLSPLSPFIDSSYALLCFSLDCIGPSALALHPRLQLPRFFMRAPHTSVSSPVDELSLFAFPMLAYAGLQKCVCPLTGVSFFAVFSIVKGVPPVALAFPTGSRGRTSLILIMG